MIDPKAGIANIKKKIAVPNYEFEVLRLHELGDRDWHPPFQRRQSVKIEVSDYNSKAGKLKL